MSLNNKSSRYHFIIFATLFYFFAFSFALSNAEEEGKGVEGRIQELEKRVPLLEIIPSRFLITGNAQINYIFNTQTQAVLGEDAGTGRLNTFQGTFEPLFLFRPLENVLLEASIEAAFNSREGVDFDIEFAQIDWFITDHVELVAGKFLSPFGAFPERIDPSFINKIPTSPRIYREDVGFLPFSDVGLQLRGGFAPSDESFKVTYALGIANTGRLQIDAQDTNGDGVIEKSEIENIKTEFGKNFSDVNKGKAFVARIGLVPFFLKNNTLYGNLEIGASVMVDRVKVEDSEPFVPELSGLNNTRTLFIWGADLFYQYRGFQFRGELARSTLSLPTAIKSDFKNTLGFYTQASYRAPGVSGILGNMEPVVRFDYVNSSNDDKDAKEIWLGLNYYIKNNFVIKFAYAFVDQTGEPNDNTLWAQLALGF